MPKKITLQSDPKLKTRTYKKRHKPTDAEKALVAQVVLESPLAITDSQIGSLARGLRRSKESIKALIEEARENFVCSSQRYVDIHKEAMEQALKNGDAKSLEVASKGSAWAITNISAEGTRLIDKGKEENSGVKIMIGLKVGGKNENTPIEAVAIKG
jgi:hypothetical protein